MLIYILIFILIFLCGIIDLEVNIEKSKKIFIFNLLILLFWFLSFIRWKCGTDWDSYYDFFRMNDKLEDFKSRGFEPLYTYINFFVKGISSNYWVLLLSLASIIYPLTSSTIKRISPYPILSLLLYLLLRRADIFFVRESIAIAFCFFSIRFIIDRKLFPFLLCILIAFNFHDSSIVFIFAYYIYSIKIKLKYISICVFMLLGIVLLYSGWVKDQFFYLSSFLGGAISYKYENYISYGDIDFGMGMSLKRAIIQGSINRVIFFIIFAYTLAKNRGNSVVSGLFNIYAFGILIFICVIPFSLALSRLVNTYEMSSLLLIGYSFKSFSPNRRFVYFLFFSIYVFVRFYMSTLTGGYSSCFVPFSTILFN